MGAQVAGGFTGIVGGVVLLTCIWRIRDGSWWWNP